MLPEQALPLTLRGGGGEVSARCRGISLVNINSFARKHQIIGIRFLSTNSKVERGEKGAALCGCLYMCTGDYVSI